MDITDVNLRQVSGGGYNLRLGESRQYSSLGAGADGGRYGLNWSNPHQPRLTFDGANVLYVDGSENSYGFQRVGAGYAADYFVQDRLSFNKKTKQYTLLSPDGSKKIFGDDGALLSKLDAYGNAAQYHYTSGELTQVTAGIGVKQVAYDYSFDTLGRLESVVFRPADSAMKAGVLPMEGARRVIYQYSGHGELEFAQLEERSEGAWVAIQASYYRYWAHGPRGRVRFALDENACRQMQKIDPAWPQAADDVTLAQYANQEFSYYHDGKAKEVKTHGGKYIYRLSYLRSAHHGSSMNVWTSRTQIVQPDGSVHTSYFNAAASLLLHEVRELSSEGQWRVWYTACQQFDGQARMVATASSEAVEAVDESSPLLFTLKAREGRIDTVSYNAQGNPAQFGVKRGAAGAVIALRALSYEAHSAQGETIYVLSNDTMWREAGQTGASNSAVTTYSYVWHQRRGKPTLQVDACTTTLPIVSNVENGDGRAAVTQEFYNQWGFVTKKIDELGVVTTYQYDQTNGALKRKVTDAGQGRLALTMDYETDALGRTTQELGPVHQLTLNGLPVKVRRATWAQYLDATHEVRTIHGCVRVADGTVNIVNPIVIKRRYASHEDVHSGWAEENISAVYAGEGMPSPIHEFARNEWVRWSTVHHSKSGEQMYGRQYHLIPNSGPGVVGINYSQTNYGYDAAGRQNLITSPEGTITLTKFNAMGWTLQVCVGTDLTAGMIATQENEYDSGQPGGNGNLTKKSLPLDQTAERVIQYAYDWRSRQVQSARNDGMGTTILNVQSYDNNDNIVQADQYENALISSNLIGRQQTSFDARGREYCSLHYGVEVGTGQVGPALLSQTYYDATGRKVRDEPEGQDEGFSIIHYDAAGRVVMKCRACGGAANLADPGSLAAVTVIEQEEVEYDAAGNQMSTTLRQRFDNASGTGALQNPEAEPKARVSYNALYSDPMGRTIAQVNYGTNGGMAWKRSNRPPTPSDVFLVTDITFDTAGNQVQITDAARRVTLLHYDQAGRQVKRVDNYVNDGFGTDQNCTTFWTYNGEDKKLTQVVSNTITGDQLTRWIYGVTPEFNSNLNSNSLLRQRLLPANSDGASAHYAYNRQGDLIATTDESCTTHVYGYDFFGRLTEDKVTAFGPGVDMMVGCIRRTYEARGLLSRVSSYADANAADPLDEVVLRYDRFKQLICDYQAHEGVANLNTTPKVGYDYAVVGDKAVRRTAIVYPNGRVLNYSYGLTDSIDNQLNRMTGLMEDGHSLTTYAYLGIDAFVRVHYNLSDVEMTLIAQMGESAGDAGDRYIGLDRFGRLVDQRWLDASKMDIERVQFGYDRSSNRKWRRNLVATGFGKDECYTYDGLNQLSRRQQGVFDSSNADISGTAASEEGFTYDQSGNWTHYLARLAGNSTIDQTRTNNVRNELTHIDGSAALVEYNAAGCMTKAPQPYGWTDAYTLSWDAWSRLVSVQSGTSTVASYKYDGLMRRTIKTVNTIKTDFFYSDQWKVIEERSETAPAKVERQFVWRGCDEDNLILRDKYNVDGSLAQRLYAINDGKNVTLVANSESEVQERYSYTGFGVPVFMDADFTPREVSSFNWEMLFCTYRMDFESNFYQVRYRWLHAFLGRWLSEDPIGYAGGSNLLCYAANNPINLSDATGLEVAPALGHKACKRRVQLLRDDQFINDTLDLIRSHDSCTVPKFVCGCCHNNLTLGPDGHYHFDTGLFDCGNPSVITMCEDIPYHQPFHVTLYNMRHELIHAKQCCLHGDNPTCLGHLCGELEAYANSGECDSATTAEARRHCIISGALQSSAKNCQGLSPRRVRKLVKRLFAICT